MVAKTRTTLEEYLCIPETKPYHELMDGELYEKPMPSWNHGTLVAYLIQVLAN